MAYPCCSLRFDIINVYQEIPAVYLCMLKLAPDIPSPFITNLFTVAIAIIEIWTWQL